MTLPQPPFQESDFGKAYQVVVQHDDMGANEPVDLSWIGTLDNGGTYEVPPEKVADFERICRVPFSWLVVPASCELTVVDE